MPVERPNNPCAASWAAIRSWAARWRESFETEELGFARAFAGNL